MRTRTTTIANKSVVCLLVATGFALHSDVSSAESLKEALSAAYRNNPSLDANRSVVRAADESVSIAHGRFRPTASATGTLSWSDTVIRGGNAVGVLDPTGTLTQGGINRQATYGVSIEQPIFTGFQLTNQLRVAEASVRGAREQLRATESAILIQAVAAYTSVLSAADILKAQEQVLSRLDNEVRIAKKRVELTQLTKTDLAQAQQRFASAASDVATARANLKTARAAFLNVVGHEPRHLIDPGLPGGMPKSLSEAQGIAAREHPLIIASLYDEEGARHTVEQIRGQLLPQVTLNASWGDTHSSSGTEFQRNTLVQGRVSVPLYEGGVVRASVRQAKQIHIGRLQTVEAVRALMQQFVSTSWSQLEAARARQDQGSAQVRASQIALEGVRTEEAIGQRTLLDVLNAEQGLLAARVSVFNARRDVVVASYQLLAQIGRLDAARIGLNSLVYDPTIHYDEVRRKWFGLNITHADGRSQHHAAHDAAADRQPSK